MSEAYGKEMTQEFCCFLVRKGVLCRPCEAAQRECLGSTWHISAISAHLLAGHGKIEQPPAALISLILEARTMISSCLATEPLFREIWLMSFFLKHGLSCECRRCSFEIFCWLLCCERLLLTARAGFFFSIAWNNFLSSSAENFVFFLI